MAGCINFDFKLFISSLDSMIFPMKKSEINMTLNWIKQLLSNSPNKLIIKISHVAFALMLANKYPI